jgi:hypothetical protein
MSEFERSPRALEMIQSRPNVAALYNYFYEGNSGRATVIVQRPRQANRGSA